MGNKYLIMHFTVDFIGIGTHKSGTTTIARFLENHPQVCFSIPKEVEYFNQYQSYRQKNKENPNRREPLSWYKKCFVHHKIGQVRGEFSGIYFTDRQAPKNIKACFPDTKLLLCLRNPIQRTYSAYQMLKNVLLHEKRSFSDFIRQEKQIIERGLYYKHLNRYLQYFDRASIQIIFLEDLKKRPDLVVKDLYRFVGVDENFIPPNLYHKENASKKASSILYYQMHLFSRKLVSLGGGKIVKWLRDKKLNKLLRNVFTRPYTYPSMSEKDEKWLKSQFLEDICQLEKLLNRDLSSWK